MVVVDGHQAREFTMGACVGLKGEMSQTSEFAERLLQHRHQSLGSLHRLNGLFGMQVLELRQSGHLFVDLGVVLHGTGAQGIEARIDTKVIVGEVGIMAYHSEFIALRELSFFCTLHRSRYLIIAKIILGQTITPAALMREFKYQ
jgi:hypothetical protein